MNQLYRVVYGEYEELCEPSEYEEMLVAFKALGIKHDSSLFSTFIIFD